MGELFLIITLSSPILFILFGILGFFAPSQSKCIDSELIDASISEVWASVINFSNYPAWVSYVSDMTVDQHDDSIWLQEGHIVPIRFQVMSNSQEETIILKSTPGNVPGKNINIESLRTIRLESVADNQTKVTLEETTEVLDPVLKSYLFFYLYFFEKKKTLGRLYLDSLQKRFQE
jgi:hypothetical protein